MIIAALLVVGLCLGSFVNALVWRLHEQETETDKKKPNKKYLKDLSISTGRSMCPDCHHTLGVHDLLPVVSWLSVGGKCRYCRRPISWQYPVVELATAGLFIASWLWWPLAVSGLQAVVFGAWLLLVTGLMALTVYDIKWMLLPDRIVYPLGAIALIMAVASVANHQNSTQAIINELLAVVIGGGLFYVLYQVSNGKWIGGGDVKLGWLLGLVVGTPAQAMLFIFIAAVLGTGLALPLLVSGKLRNNSVIPFGPLLISGAIISVLFGGSILAWYQHLVLV